MERFPEPKRGSRFHAAQPVDQAHGAEKVEGRIVVLSGKDGRPLRTLAPLAGEHAFGSDLVSIGDLNGDKKEELLVRTPVGAAAAESGEDNA